MPRKSSVCSTFFFAGERIVQIAERIERIPPTARSRSSIALAVAWFRALSTSTCISLVAAAKAGFSTRMEVMLSDLTSCGITTVVGTLGTGSVTRHDLPLGQGQRARGGGHLDLDLHRRLRRVPVPALTGSVRTDLIIVDKVVGVGEVAMSDHRSSQPTSSISLNSRRRRVGGMLSGKAGCCTSTWATARR